MSGKFKGNLTAVFKYVLLCIVAVICLYPLVWLFISSFKTQRELFANPWGLPAAFDLGNYKQAIEEGHIFRYFFNSVIISTATVIISLLLSAMASFAIARMRWKLSNLVLNIFLLGMMIPVYAMVVPLFSMFHGMGLLNTYLSIIIPQLAISFPTAIFIISGFMSSIPGELEEAAIIDGCNIYQLFFNIVLPVAKSSLVTVAVVVFINVWNDLLLPQIFLSDVDRMTLPVGLTQFQGMYSTNYVAQIAAVIISIIPTIVVYVILQKHIMEGMTAGAVKG